MSNNELEVTVDEETTLTADESVDIETTDETADAPVEDNLPKSWTDADKAQYAIAKEYFKAIDTEGLTVEFDGFENKVVTRAKRDAK